MKLDGDALYKRGKLELSLSLFLSLPGEGCGGLRHAGTLLLHGGRPGGEEHVRPLPGPGGAGGDPAAVGQGQQNVPGHRQWSVSGIRAQPSPRLQVRHMECLLSHSGPLQVQVHGFSDTKCDRSTTETWMQ